MDKSIMQKYAQSIENSDIDILMDIQEYPRVYLVVNTIGGINVIYNDMDGVGRWDLNGHNYTNLNIRLFRNLPDVNILILANDEHVKRIYKYLITNTSYKCTLEHWFVYKLLTLNPEFIVNYHVKKYSTWYNIVCGDFDLTKSSPEDIFGTNVKIANYVFNSIPQRLQNITIREIFNLLHQSIPNEFILPYVEYLCYNIYVDTLSFDDFIFAYHNESNLNKVYFYLDKLQINNMFGNILSKYDYNNYYTNTLSQYYYDNIATFCTAYNYNLEGRINLNPIYLKQIKEEHSYLNYNFENALICVFPNNITDYSLFVSAPYYIDKRNILMSITLSDLCVGFITICKNKIFNIYIIPSIRHELIMPILINWSLDNNLLWNV